MYLRYFYIKTFFILFLSLFNSNVNSRFLSKDFKLISLASSTMAIKDAKGYEEGAFVEWKGPASGTYSVYYKTGSSSYIQIDSMLIRQYPTYFRADALGLKPNDETFIANNFSYVSLVIRFHFFIQWSSGERHNLIKSYKVQMVFICKIQKNVLKN